MISAARIATCNAVAPMIGTGPVTYCFSPGLIPKAGTHNYVSSVSVADLQTAALRYMHSRGWNRVAVLTSNRSRDLHDALRRRCLYHWIDYPEPARAAAIVRRTVPGATAPLIEHATQFVGSARDLDLDKPPGVAETIDWVAALVSLGVADLVDESALTSLGALAKTPDDRTLIRDAFKTFTEYSRT